MQLYELSAFAHLYEIHTFGKRLSWFSGWKLIHCNILIKLNLFCFTCSVTVCRSLQCSHCWILLFNSFNNKRFQVFETIRLTNFLVWNEVLTVVRNTRVFVRTYGHRSVYHQNEGKKTRFEIFEICELIAFVPIYFSKENFMNKN